MRTQVLAALVAGGTLLGGCSTTAGPAQRHLDLTRATRTDWLDVSGPRVDPRTRTGAVERAGSVADLAVPRQVPTSGDNEPERQQVEDAPAYGGSGPAGY